MTEADDAEATTESPLPRSRSALDWARRMLDQLQGKEAFEQEYRDFLPWVLDRLENVWRTISAESSGRRTHAFGTWWATQREGNRSAINYLRNAEVKRNERTTTMTLSAPSDYLIHVAEDGSMSVVAPDGTVLPRNEDGSLPTIRLHIDTTSPNTTITWEFRLPGLEGRTVQEVLELAYMRLESEVLPTAEKHLQNDGAVS